jgi:hypothetical protein
MGGSHNVFNGGIFSFLKGHGNEADFPRFLHKSTGLDDLGVVIRLQICPRIRSQTEQLEGKCKGSMRIQFMQKPQKIHLIAISL